jgi:hypothetical protein
VLKGNIWKRLEISAALALGAVIFTGLAYLYRHGEARGWRLPVGFAPVSQGEIVSHTAAWLMFACITTFGVGGMDMFRSGGTPNERKFRYVARIYFLPLLITFGAIILETNADRWKMQLVFAVYAALALTELWRWVRKGVAPLFWHWAVPLSVVILLLSYYRAGLNSPETTKEFMIIPGTPERVVLALRDTDAVVARFDRKAKTLDREREVIHLEPGVGGTLLRYVVEEVGPLKVLR